MIVDTKIKIKERLKDACKNSGKAGVEIKNNQFATVLNTLTEYRKRIKYNWTTISVDKEAVTGIIGILAIEGNWECYNPMGREDFNHFAIFFITQNDIKSELRSRSNYSSCSHYKDFFTIKNFYGYSSLRICTMWSEETIVMTTNTNYEFYWHYKKKWEPIGSLRCKKC